MKTCPEVIARQDEWDAEGRLMWFLTKANSNSEVGTENSATLLESSVKPRKDSVLRECGRAPSS